MKAFLAIIAILALAIFPPAVVADDEEPAPAEAEEAQGDEPQAEEGNEGEDAQPQDEQVNPDDPDGEQDPAADPAEDETPAEEPKPAEPEKKLDLPYLLKIRTESKAQNGENMLGEKSKQVNDSIHAALKWFAATQESDGSWDAKKWEGTAAGPEVSTAMALLSFLGDGCTGESPEEFAPTVKKAVEYLIAKQNQNGSWGIKSATKMYEEGIIAIAVCEAAALMPQNEKLKDAAQNAINFIASVQAPDGGFGYQGEGDDNSVSNFQFQALKAAMTAGLDIPADFKAKTENWLKICVAKDGSSAYRPKLNQPGRDSMTAASLASRLLLGEDKNSPASQAQAKWLLQKDFKKAGAPGENNLYSVYYLSLSMFQMGEKLWADWRDVYIKAVIDKQEKEGKLAGSWPKKSCQWGAAGGRIYTTAFACLALEAAYRYERKADASD